MEEDTSEWYRNTVLGDGCDYETHCPACSPNGDCNKCDTIGGRWMEAVNEYASTCDGCGQLTAHERLTMDPETQLGYCSSCVPNQSEEIRCRLKANSTGMSCPVDV